MSENTWVTKIDPASSAEKQDWLLTQITSHDILQMGFIFRCHLKILGTTCKARIRKYSKKYKNQFMISIDYNFQDCFYHKFTLKILHVQLPTL